MITEIIEAISVALNSEFGDDYEIHMEEIRQGLTEPCFFITCLNPSLKPLAGNRYHCTNQFCINYFPESEEKQQECNAVGERMIWCLEYITKDGDSKPIRGTKMNYEVIDGVLSFFVNYDCIVTKTESQTAMEILETNTVVKEGD